MNTKHTPGPWYLAKDADSTERVYVNGQEIVRALATHGHGGRRIPAAERAANRRLLAAAPDLLAALRAWVESTSFDEQTGSMAPVYKAARAAIAKATGGAA